MAAQRSCWFKSLALSSLGVVLVEGELTATDTQTVILKMIQANQDYCLAYSPEEEEDSDRPTERQGGSIGSLKKVITLFRSYRNVKIWKSWIYTTNI